MAVGTVHCKAIGVCTVEGKFVYPFHKAGDVDCGCFANYARGEGIGFDDAHGIGDSDGDGELHESFLSDFFNGWGQVDGSGAGGTVECTLSDTVDSVFMVVDGDSCRNDHVDGKDVAPAVIIALHGGEFHGAIGGDAVIVGTDFMVSGVVIGYLSCCGHSENHEDKN